MKVLVYSETEQSVGRFKTRALHLLTNQRGASHLVLLFMPKPDLPQHRITVGGS